MRSELSPESPAFPFSKLDNVGRETPNAAAIVARERTFEIFST
jgi:hypothetical protein